MDFLTAYNSDCSEDDATGNTDDSNNIQGCCDDSKDQSECSNSLLLSTYDLLNKVMESQTIVNESMMNKECLNDSCLTMKSPHVKQASDDPEQLRYGEHNVTSSSADGKNSSVQICQKNGSSLNSYQGHSSEGELTSQNTNSKDALSADYFNLVAGNNKLGQQSESDQCDEKFFSYDVKASNKIASVDFWANGLTPLCNWSQPEQIWGMPSESDSEINTQTLSCHSSVPGSTTTNVPWKRKKLADNAESLDNFESDSVKTPCFTLHHKIAPHLNDARMNKINSRCPKKVAIVLPGHSGTVNRINWCVAEYGHLLLSAAMDSTVRIWNAISSSSNPCVRTLRCHNKAVKDAIWMQNGKHIVSCGFDKTARFCDVEQG
jgi:WD40 repeat protein